MRKKDWLKFLRIIFYFLAIISLALSIMGRMARAEEALPSNLISVLEDDIATVNPSAHDYIINNLNLIEEYPHVVRMISYDNTYVAYFFLRSNIYGLRTSSSYTDGYIGNQVFQYTFYVLADSVSVAASSMDMYMFIVNNNSYCITRCTRTGSNYNCTYYQNIPLYLYEYGSANGSDKQLTQTGTCNVYSCNSNSGYIDYSYVSGYTHQINTISKGMKNLNYIANFDCIALNYNVAWATTFSKWDEVYPPSVVDSRLKLDTIISSGRKELVVDMSAFIDDLYASSYTISDFVLTLDYDGVEQTFNDLGEYINIYGTSSGRDCLAIIPYSVFGFDDNNNISDVSVSVTKVSFTTNALYPNRPTVTESFNIATSYYLKNDLDNSIEWDDTNVIESPNETIQYDGDDFNDLKTSMENPEMQDHGTIYNDWHYVSSLPVWEGWESIYNVDIFTFADSFNVEHTWYHVRADFDTSLVQQFGLYYYVPFKISNWLYDNAISNYYDVLVFKNYHGKYEDVDITAPDDYLIFYSNRYYLKRHILELGNVHKTISSIGNQIFTLYDFTYKRMNDINGNIQKGFENVLSKDNAIIGLLSSVNFNLDKFGNMINSNLVSVVSGINGLEGSDNRDLTDIYNRLGNMITSVDLTGILSNLFVPTYTGFQDSFDDAIESMGILALPFDVSKRFIIASRVPYSSTLNVTFPEYEFNNLQYWDEYEFEFNPNSILSADWLEFLQYCNALFVIVTVTLLTYKHIFASPVSEESGVL